MLISQKQRIIAKALENAEEIERLSLKLVDASNKFNSDLRREFQSLTSMEIVEIMSYLSDSPDMIRSLDATDKVIKVFEI